jgi:hypothetical protein
VKVGKKPNEKADKKQFNVPHESACAAMEKE